MLAVSIWIFTLLSMKISWQKSDYKNSENSIVSADKPINFTLSSNSLFLAPSKNSSCFGTSPLPSFDKISVISGMGNSFFFWSSSLSWLTYLPLLSSNMCPLIWNNSSSSLSFGIVAGCLRLLYLRCNSSPPSLLSPSSSSSTLLPSKFVSFLLLSSFLSILP